MGGRSAWIRHVTVLPVAPTGPENPSGIGGRRINVAERADFRGFSAGGLYMYPANYSGPLRNR